MTEFLLLAPANEVPTHITRHERSRRRPGFAHRLQAAFGAFLAPERLRPAANDNPGDAAPVSLADPLALPPEWHGHEWGQGGDLIGLSFLPFDR
ncbi:MAG: hypothetical protein ACK4FK_05900 [Ferrovibrio sp.]|jgi:hypothetical protein|uniref:hypothetical protein n=1 Tax=Ferrovibrio sp. TaxID=1917215 RepID=UPI00391C639D